MLRKQFKLFNQNELPSSGMHVAFSIDAWFVPGHLGEESFGEVVVPVKVAVDVELE